MSILYDVETFFHEDRVTNRLGIERRQFIPQTFVDQCRAQREGTARDQIGNWLPVASIPVEVGQDLLRRGVCDVWNDPFDKIIAALKSESLDYFILTNKSV